MGLKCWSVTQKTDLILVIFSHMQRSLIIGAFCGLIIAALPNHCQGKVHHRWVWCSSLGGTVTWTWEILLHLSHPYFLITFNYPSSTAPISWRPQVCCLYWLILQNSRPIFQRNWLTQSNDPLRSHFIILFELPTTLEKEKKIHHPQEKAAVFLKTVLWQRIKAFRAMQPVPRMRGAQQADASESCWFAITALSIFHWAFAPVAHTGYWIILQMLLSNSSLLYWWCLRLTLK